MARIPLSEMMAEPEPSKMDRAKLALSSMKSGSRKFVDLLADMGKKRQAAELSLGRRVVGGGFEAVTGLASPVSTEEARAKGIGLRSPIAIAMPGDDTDRSRSLAITPFGGMTGESSKFLPSLLLREPVVAGDRSQTPVIPGSAIAKIPMDVPGLAGGLIGGIAVPGPGELLKGIGVAAAAAPLFVKGIDDFIRMPKLAELKASFQASGHTLQFGFFKTNGKNYVPQHVAGGRFLPTQSSSRWDESTFDTFGKVSDHVDQIVKDLPDGGLSAENWRRQMNMRLPGLKGADVIAEPKTYARWAENPQDLIDWLGDAVRQRPLLLSEMQNGIAMTSRNYDLAKQGRLTKEHVALHYVWGALSKGTSPFNQEALWIRLTRDPEVASHIKASIDGTYNLAESQWRKLIKTTLGRQRKLIPKKGEKGLKAGFAAEMNANSLHAMLLHLNGKWEGVTAVMNNTRLNGTQMSEEIFRHMANALPKNKSGERVGIGLSDKVNRFVIASIARDDVWIGDRWQVTGGWGDNLVSSIRDAATKGRLKGKQVLDLILSKSKKTGMMTGAGPFYDAVNGLAVPATKSLTQKRVTPLPAAMDARTHAIYRGVEAGLRTVIEKAGPGLAEIFGGRPSVFALHWLTWAVQKNEAVGHSSLGLLTELAESGRLEKDFLKSLREIDPRVSQFDQLASEEGILSTTKRTFSMEGDVPTIRVEEIPNVGTSGLPTVSVVEATPNEFAAARDAMPPLKKFFLGHESPEELSRFKLRMDANGTSGVALRPLPNKGQELVNLFRSPGAIKGSGGSHSLWAIQNGATELNNFDRGLTEFYTDYGFVPVARMKFVKEFAPETWDLAEHGTPDVMFMVYRGGDRGTLPNRLGTFPKPVKDVPYIDEWPEHGIENYLKGKE